MAKGSLAKTEITNKILETFDGAFLYNGGKELRIPFEEDGNEVQIKITLTCAKENVSSEGSSAPSADKTPVLENQSAEPTKEELEQVQNLMKKLNL